MTSNLSIFFFCHLCSRCHILETIAYSAIMKFASVSFSEGFIVVALTLRSLNRSELNFAHVGRGWDLSHCILLHGEIQSS